MHNVLQETISIAWSTALQPQYYALVMILAVGSTTTGGYKEKKVKKKRWHPEKVAKSQPPTVVLSMRLI